MGDRREGGDLRPIGERRGGGERGERWFNGDLRFGGDRGERRPAGDRERLLRLGDGDDDPSI